MRTRKANKVNQKLSALIYGDTFTGKTTLALQIALMHNPDRSPMKVAVIDAESGGVDFALEKLEDQGVNMDNIKVFYSQSLQEIFEVLQKIKDHEVFYYTDDDGDETDEAMLDADGKEWHPDAVVVDGTSVLRQSSEQGLLELSKKRNAIKANQQGLTGAEKTVKVQSASLEMKDWGALKHMGQKLALELKALDVHSVITAREKKEKDNIKDGQGGSTSVDTGRKIPDSFNGIDYNMNTVIRTFIDSDTEQVCAEVVKDRTETFPAGTVIEDPTLLAWEPAITKRSKGKNFVLNNDLDNAIEAEQKAYEKQSNSILGDDNASNKGGDDAAELSHLRKEISEKIRSLPPAEKQSVKNMLKEKGLPTAFKKVTNVDVLKKVIEEIESAE